MTIAHWCVLIALLMPYIFSVLSRSNAKTKDYIRDPRAFSETLVGWHRRAHLVQLNCFEAFPAFAAAVIIAYYQFVPQVLLDIAALTFIFFRCLYALFYLWDKPFLRSLSWKGGMLIIIGIFVIASRGL